MNSVRDLPFGRGFPIRTSADQRSLASPRGFSQRATSFIASWRQGIHRTPFIHSISLPPPPARRTKAHRTSGEQFTEALAQSLTLVHSITCSLGHAVPHQSVPRPQSHWACLPRTSWPLRRARSYSPCERSPLPPSRPRLARLSRRRGFARARYEPCGVSLFAPGARAAGSLSGSPPCLADLWAAGLPGRGEPRPPCRMEAIGFEPTTPCLQSRRSPS